MATIPHDVVNAFNAGKFKQRGSFHSSGSELTSYAFRIAWRDEDGHIRLNPQLDGYVASATTNIHLQACHGLYDEVAGKTLRHAKAGRTWELA